MSEIMEYSKQQSEAIEAIIEWFKVIHRNKGISQSNREFYLAGSAGTGKTTITKRIIEILKDEFQIREIVCVAYTGKAVDVLRSRGMSNSSTVHSLIYSPRKDPKTGKTVFELSHTAAAATVDLIILDECSTVSDKMASDLRSFGKPMLIIGDEAQLPPISGMGFTNGRTPDYELTEIHRQVADSPILKLATMARNREHIQPGVYGDNVLVTDKYDEETINNYIIKRGTQPICGTNQTRKFINRIFRKRMGFGADPYPQAGEKLICCQNDMKLGLFNGIMGVAFADTVTGKGINQRKCDVFFKSDSKSSQIKDRFSSWKSIFETNYHDNMKEPEFLKGTQKFDFGYALTCHKSQGSEWDTVTVIDESYIFKENAHKHLYTAITRARKKLIIIQP